MLMLGPGTNIALAQASSGGVESQQAAERVAHAYDVRLGLRPSFEKCNDVSDGVTSALLDCDGDEYVFQDKRLNRAYKSLLARLETQGKIQLRDQERVWIKFRDTHCDIHDTGGTADDINTHGCLLEQTALHAKQLEERLKIGNDC